MKKAALFGVSALLFAFCSLPALAAPDPAASAAFAAIFAPAPEVSAQPQAEDVAARRGLPSQVDLHGQLLGWLHGDLHRNLQQRGQLQLLRRPERVLHGDDHGNDQLPRLPGGGPCTATAACSPSGSVSCTGAAGYTGCFAVRNCYADCGGALVWCPSHGSCPL